MYFKNINHSMSSTVSILISNPILANNYEGELRENKEKSEFPLMGTRL